MMFIKTTKKALKGCSLMACDQNIKVGSVRIVYSVQSELFESHAEFKLNLP